MMIRMAIYARVSTTNHSQDVTLQTRELEQFAQVRGWQTVDTYIDAGVSGAKDSRPELNRLMADAHKRRFDDRWAFVHRSLQDFLAAQYWVETGMFAQAVQRNEIRFDSRTAFAGCLVDNATHLMEVALGSEEGLPVFAEMLMNDPSFDHKRIASAIIGFYEYNKGEHYYRRTDEKIECYHEQEFIQNASSKFLEYVIQVCAPKQGKTTDTLAAYALQELKSRRFRLAKSTYDLCKKNYPADNFAFVISDKGFFRLKDVPHI